MQHKPLLPLEDPRAIAAAAQAEAQAHAWAVTIAIVDDGGHLLWLQRLDGAAPISAQIAPARPVLTPIHAPSTVGTIERASSQ